VKKKWVLMRREASNKSFLAHCPKITGKTKGKFDIGGGGKMENNLLDAQKEEEERREER